MAGAKPPPASATHSCCKSTGSQPHTHVPALPLSLGGELVPVVGGEPLPPEVVPSLVVCSWPVSGSDEVIEELVIDVPPSVAALDIDDDGEPSVLSPALLPLLPLPAVV
jgi:hypothetical protein